MYRSTTVRHRQPAAKLKDGRDHREHQRIGRDPLLGSLVHRHALEVGQQRARPLGTEALLERLPLLVHRERLELETAEAGVALIFDAVRSRGGEQDVALRREDLGDVPLDLLALLAALVEAVQQEQRTARRHCLAQHQVRGLAVLEAEEGVDPVPRRPERVWLVEQPRLQQLHLDEDGNELGVGAVERVHDDLVEQ